MISKYKDYIYQLQATSNGTSSLGRLNVKLPNSKRDAALNEFGIVNIIDSQKAELTTFDPKLTKSVISGLQSADLNLTIITLSPSKILISFPKQTAADKNLIIEQLKKRTQNFKNEIREIRRSELNKFRASTKDKDEIKNFELQIQKTFEKLSAEIDKEFDLVFKKITN